MDTSYPRDSGEPAKTSEGRHDAESSRTSSRNNGARRLRFVSSEIADSNLHDKLGTKEIAILYEIVDRNAVMDPYLHIVVHRKTEQVGFSFPSKGYSS